MTINQIDVLVEELSMEALLRELLPRLVGEHVTVQIYPFNGKGDLMSKLPARLKGYAHWLPPTQRIVILVDRDDEDCRQLKSRLENIAAAAGLTTKSQSRTPVWQVVNRIAVAELEAWYFGDWQAVIRAYPRAPNSIPRKAKFRDPDNVSGGTWEAFERVMQRAGYFGSGLRKIEAARAITPHMDPPKNSSPSFQALRKAVAEAVAPATALQGDEHD